MALDNTEGKAILFDENNNIQIGVGTNEGNGVLQVNDFPLLDLNNGTIIEDRMPNGFFYKEFIDSSNIYFSKKEDKASTSITFSLKIHYNGQLHFKNYLYANGSSSEKKQVRTTVYLNNEEIAYHRNYIPGSGLSNDNTTFTSEIINVKKGDLLTWRTTCNQYVTSVDYQFDIYAEFVDIVPEGISIVS